MLAGHRNAGRMNLGEAGVSEERATFVSAIGGGDVATAGVSRKEKNVAVTASGEHYGITGEGIDFARAKIAGDDSLGVTIYEHEVEHFRLRKHCHSPERDLATERLIGAQQKLLSRLAARIKCP